MAAKDKLIDLLQDRFSGLEMDVPPGAWEAINGQLVQVADADALRETLQDKFSGHELDVDPGVWQNISSQLGHGAAAGAGASTGWLAAGAAAVVLAGGLLYWNLNTPEEVVVATPVPQERTVVPIPPEDAPSTPAVAVAPVPSAPAATTDNVQRRTTPSANSANGLGATAPEDPNSTAAGRAMVEKILRDLEEMRPNSPAAKPSGSVSPPSDVAAGSDPTSTPSGPNSALTSEPASDPLMNGTAEVAGPEIFIPNVFTPNGDGWNESLAVKGIRYKSVLVRIFSASDNTLVFEAADLDHNWDGRLPNGQPAQSGMYFYALEVVGTDGHSYTKGQTVHLNP